MSTREQRMQKPENYIHPTVGRITARTYKRGINHFDPDAKKLTTTKKPAVLVVLVNQNKSTLLEPSRWNEIKGKLEDAADVYGLLGLAS